MWIVETLSARLFLLVWQLLLLKAEHKSFCSQITDEHYGGYNLLQNKDLQVNAIYFLALLSFQASIIL